MSWNNPLQKKPTAQKDMLLMIRHRGEHLQQVGFVTESNQWFVQSFFGPMNVGEDKIIGWKAIDADNVMIPVAQKKWSILLDEGAKFCGFMFSLRGQKGIISTFGKVVWVE